MPEDRLPADLNHGLWSECRLLTDPRTESARQDNNLHMPAPFDIVSHIDNGSPPTSILYVFAPTPAKSCLRATET